VVINKVTGKANRSQDGFNGYANAKTLAAQWF
jgi:hypothetical protein